ncbi:M23 family metallopeptidase [Gemmatimonas sp.]|uniref:M23 family metallopeptidase n=1 Tax=Gemmatimonas sp. TaxID=1962908 RepID=UPI00333EF136
MFRLACFALLSTLVSPLRAQAVRLPSRQSLFVLQGGDTPNVNHHMTVAAQAFGVDFAVVGGTSGRELAPSGVRRIEEFYCWDTPVISPVSGQVVQVVDSLPDNPLGTHDTVNLLGNHVVIRSAERFFYLGHFRRGSIVVRTGNSVEAGGIVGRCGNSGNSDFPHIHLHATASARFGEGVGINLLFGPIRAELSGTVFEQVECPMLAGLWVRSPGGLTCVAADGRSVEARCARIQFNSPAAERWAFVRP